MLPNLETSKSLIDYFPEISLKSNSSTNLMVSIGLSQITLLIMANPNIIYSICMIFFFEIWTFFVPKLSKNNLQRQ